MNIGENPSFKEQQNSYQSWVNSQLRKTKYARCIFSLTDESVRNGTTLATLVSIVSNEELTGINPAPQSEREYLHNVALLLQQLQARNVKMHSVIPSAIVKGDVKSIMRVILAIAAHYKPMSVCQQETTKAYEGNSKQSNRDRRVKPPKLNTEQASKVYSKTQTESDRSNQNSYLNAVDDNHQLSNFDSLVESSYSTNHRQSITQIMQGVAVGLAKTKQEILMSPSIECRSKFTFDSPRTARSHTHDGSQTAYRSNQSYHPQEDIIAASSTTTMTLSNRPEQSRERALSTPGHAVPCPLRYEKLRSSPSELLKPPSDNTHLESNQRTFISSRKVQIKKGSLKTRSFSHSERPISDLSSSCSVHYQDQACQTDSFTPEINNETSDMASEALEETLAMKSILFELQSLIQQESNTAVSQNSSPEILHLKNDNNNTISHPIRTKIEDLEELVKSLRQSLSEQQEQTQSWQDSAKYWRSVVEEMTQKMTTQISNEVYKRDEEIQRLLKLNEENSKLLKFYETEREALKLKCSQQEEALLSLKPFIQTNCNIDPASNTQHSRDLPSQSRREVISSDESYLNYSCEPTTDTCSTVNEILNHQSYLEINECLDSLRLSLPSNDSNQSILNRIEFLLTPHSTSRTKQSSRSLNVPNPSSQGFRPEPKARTSVNKFKKSLTTDCLDSDIITCVNPNVSLQPNAMYQYSSSSNNTRGNTSLPERNSLVNPATESIASRPLSNNPFSNELAFPGQPVQKLNPFYDERVDSLDQHHSTNVLCHTDKSITPFMVTIPKISQEICLSDIKRYSQYSQPRYRFLFKSFDKIFGPMKREIFHDADHVPMWEDKIIVWIIEKEC